MLSITTIFSEVYAASPQAGGEPPTWLSYLPIVAIFLIFWFLIIRPQQKKAKAHKQLIREIQKGDQVITASGIFGTITKVFDDKNYVLIEIADKVVIKLVREHVADVVKRKSTKNNDSD